MSDYKQTDMCNSLGEGKKIIMLTGWRCSLEAVPSSRGTTLSGHRRCGPL